jgi:hypothetical protein
MGEIADMMLDGTMDCETAEWNFDGEDGPGWPMTGAEAEAYRNGADLVSTDEECREYLNDLPGAHRAQAAFYLRTFMGVGKKRAKKLVGQWRASGGAPA